MRILLKFRPLNNEKKENLSAMRLHFWMTISEIYVGIFLSYFVIIHVEFFLDLHVSL